MMPAFSLAAFVDTSLLYVLAHPFLIGAVACCGVLVAARLITMGVDARYDRDDDPAHLTAEQARHIHESMQRARMETVVDITERRKRDGRAS